ncbi:MAG: 1-deoxy-D-xylulose-5-phosphate reductoisomerase [Magnetococcus sp. DMHC-6]
MIKNIAILGSTGSIGVSTLDVIATHPDRFRAIALAAGRNSQLLIAQAKRFHPQVVAMHDIEAAREVAFELSGLGIEVLVGAEGIAAVGAWDGVHMTVSAIVGGDGLLPTMAAIRAGKEIALANKECLVMAGALFKREMEQHKGSLIPVDSEHSAIFQVLNNGQVTPKLGEGVGKGGHFVNPGRQSGFRELILTASGGPFRGWSREQLAQVTPTQALAHPNWKMGPKISIDSATLMNKGLEVIEAYWLFGVELDRIQVVVHPESIVHSMVSYADGSVLAQMGVPDMRTPIAVALAWPERIAVPVKPLDLAALGRLTFFGTPDPLVFPCLGLSYQALRQGGAAPAILNAANEVAVAAFLGP